MPTNSLDGLKNAFKGPFSEFRRCVYGQDSCKHQLDFSLEFWRTYKDHPKFQTINLMDSHEFTGELSYYLDQHLPSFFESMLQEGLLDDSIVLLISDHGNNANLFFKGTASGKIELANPFFMMLLSSNNAEKYGRTLAKNEQKLISAHDVNRILNEVIGIKKEFNGINFMLHEVDPLRTCGNAMIPPEFCKCFHSQDELEYFEKHKYEFDGVPDSS